MSEKIYKEGDFIKNFKLPGINSKGEEKEYILNEILNDKYLILYFYPRDNTSGCTTEARDFRDNYEIIKNNFIIVGISPDSIESHKKFMNKYELNFILLSDKKKEIMKRFGAFGEKKMYGQTRMGVIRSTFIINKDMKIIKSWRNVRAKGHVNKVLEWINKNIEEV